MSCQKTSSLHNLSTARGQHQRTKLATQTAFQKKEKDEVLLCFGYAAQSKCTGSRSFGHLQ